MGSSVLALMARIHFFPLVWLFLDKCLVIVWETQSHLKSWQSLSSSFASSVFPLKCDDWSRLLKKLETPSVEMRFWILNDQGRLPKKLNVILILDKQRRFCKKAPNTFWYCNKTPAEAPVTVSALKRGGRQLVQAASEKLFKLLFSLNWDLLKAPVTLRTTSNTLDWLRSFEKQLLLVIICQRILLHITEIK